MGGWMRVHGVTATKLEACGTSRELIVILHGAGGSPGGMGDVRAAVRDACPDADLLVPRLPFSGMWGFFALTRVERIVLALLRLIDDTVRARKARDGGEYAAIRIVGHSFGAVLARKITILAHGEDPDAPFEKAYQDVREGYEWAGRISRLVLLAGMSRGWAPENALTWMLSAQWRLYALLGELMTLFIRRAPTIMAIRQGAPFLVQTRLQWLALMRSLVARGAPQVEDAGAMLRVVQTVGTIDDLVAPGDQVDFAIDVQPGRDNQFHLLELPATTHKNAIVMRKPDGAFSTWAAQPTKRGMDTSQRDGTGRHALHAVVRDATADPTLDPEVADNVRWQVFQAALTGEGDLLKTFEIPRTLLADDLLPAPEPDVRNVVFVIHGIRDRGYWTQKIARAIKKEAQAARGDKKTLDWRSLTPSYGYFAMAPFVLPWVRRWKTGWLMERYAEAKARYPNAEFHYVGHSNGTYLLARALQDYPAARFNRIVFAGSVVRRSYRWTSLMPDHVADAHGADAGREGAKPRVRQVLNYVATADWVVALFPKGMQPFRMLDLGSAGHDGFKDGAVLGPSRLHQVTYVKGGHGAGIKESNWDDIARFVVRGERPKRDAEHQKLWARGLGYASAPLLLFGVWLFLGIGVAMFNGMTGPASFNLGHLWTTVAAYQPQQWTAPGPLEVLAAVWSAACDVFGWILLAVLSWCTWLPQAFLNLFRWLQRALTGEITLPFLDCDSCANTGTAWRAAVFAIYCKLLHLVITRV